MALGKKMGCHGNGQKEVAPPRNISTVHDKRVRSWYRPSDVLNDGWMLMRLSRCQVKAGHVLQEAWTTTTPG